MILTAPAIMMCQRRWVARIGKKPCDTYGRMEFYTNERITWKDPRMWTTFNQAVDAYERSRSRRGKIDGIGYIITKDDSLPADKQVVGVDLDCCRDPITGEGSAWALSTLQRLNSPTGVSISDCGYRAFCLGRLPDGLGSIEGHGVDDLTEECKDHILLMKPDCTAFNGFEAYMDGPRHLSVTGLWLPGYPSELDIRSKEIAEISAPFLRHTPAKSPVRSPAQSVQRMTTSYGRSQQLGCGFVEMMPLAELRERVSILDAINTAGFVEDSGGQLVGANPIIGSKTGHNLSVDPSRGIWISFHAGHGRRGGTIVDWLACASGAVDWSEAGRSLSRDEVIQLLEYAVDRGLITDAEAFPGRKK